MSTAAIPLTSRPSVARRGGRGGVGCIVLGRGEDEAQVESWLSTAAGVPGFIGFAVGRTTFGDALVGWRDGRVPRAAAVAEIARRYTRWCQLFAARAAEREALPSRSAQRSAEQPFRVVRREP